MRAFLVAWLAGCVVLLLGWYLLGIHPTFAEVVLVSVACGVATGIQEGLR